MVRSDWTVLSLRLSLNTWDLDSNEPTLSACENRVIPNVRLLDEMLNAEVQLTRALRPDL